MRSGRSLLPLAVLVFAAQIDVRAFGHIASTHYLKTVPPGSVGIHMLPSTRASMLYQFGAVRKCSGSRHNRRLQHCRFEL
jgi:hypothetical protein